MQHCLAGFEAGAHSWSDGISFRQRCLFVTFSRAKTEMLRIIAILFPSKKHPVGGEGAFSCK